MRRNAMSAASRAYRTACAAPSLGRPPASGHRSELVALNVDHLEFSSAGVIVTLRCAKTDPKYQRCGSSALRATAGPGNHACTRLLHPLRYLPYHVCRERQT